MALFAPRIRPTAQNTQYTYSTDHRIHDAKTHPVRSPQGATILICGHENGITLTWCGGRRLKPPRSAGKESRNGANAEDAVMILDSDDEAPSAKSTAGFVDKPEFEDESGTDSAVPETVQTLDLALGTAVLHVAVLPMGPCAAEDAAWSGAEMLKEKMVFAVACATSDVYVVTLPLTPPSHESKARPELRKDLLAGSAGRGTWGETLTLLTGQRRRNEGLAVALVKQKSGSERSRSIERPSAAPTTRVVVAAHSREANGTLRLWDVPLESRPGTIGRVEPFQTEYLPSPLTGVSFNPRHSTQLLTVASAQAVRIYDYALASLPSDDASEGPFPAQGSWLLSLYAPFSRGAQASRARKPIVAASWISGGRAVLVLLADGQWGIWDIDGASPSAKGNGQSSSLFGKHATGLRGSAITTFSVTGHLEGTSPLRTQTSQKASAAPGPGEFVPMTPHTRRDTLASSMAGGPERLTAVRGGIDVTQLAQNGSAATTPPEEAAVLWLGSGVDPIVAIIPGVARFWDAQLRRGVGGGVNLFSGAQPTRMLRLTELRAGLLGERCTGAAALVRFGSGGSGDNANSAASGSGSTDGLPVDVLLRGETRLVVVREGGDGGAPASSIANRFLGARSDKRTARGNRAVSTNAIIAYPRPEKPGSVVFNLSVSRRGTATDVGRLRVSRQRAPVAGLFDNTPISPEDDDTGTTVVAKQAQLFPSSFRDTGLLFAHDLGQAADQPDDEAEAEARDVEREMMDIMEIDRELEALESEREKGTKHVFFEEG